MDKPKFEKIILPPFFSEDTNDIEEISSPHIYVLPLIHCDFAEDSMIKVLENIKVNKTPGPEDIAPRFSKKQKIKSLNLSITFTESLNLGTAPSEWKLGNGTPFKGKG